MATKPTDPTTAIIDSHRAADGMCDITSGITIPWPSVNRSSGAVGGHESDAAAAQPCPEATYRTRVYAKRAAWIAADKAGVRRQEPVQCTPCRGWHVVGPQPTTTKGRV